MDPLTGQGYALLLQKKSRQARELAQRAEALAPVDDSVLSLLGDIAMVEEQFAAALDYYDRALEANPNNFNARLRRVVLHMASNDLDAADADIDFVLTQFPDNPRALVAKAMLLIRQDRNPESQRLLEEFNYRLSGITRKEMSANVNIQIIRAQTHYLQGAFAQALPLLRDINKAYPEKTFVRQMLTDTYYAGGRYDEIVDLYRPITILGFTPPFRTYPKRPIMAPEVCHAKTKKILRGV